MVQPDKINDDEAIVMARDIRKKIEEEMEYPGHIKVMVVRETRAVESIVFCRSPYGHCRHFRKGLLYGRR